MVQSKPLNSKDLAATTVAATTLDSARGCKVSHVSYLKSHYAFSAFRTMLGLSKSQSKVMASNHKNHRFSTEQDIKTVLHRQIQSYQNQPFTVLVVMSTSVLDWKAPVGQAIIQKTLPLDITEMNWDTACMLLKQNIIGTKYQFFSPTLQPRPPGGQGAQVVLWWATGF